MENQILFSLISTSIYLIGAVPYWKNTIQGKTLPHVFTAGIWSILVGFNCYVLFIHQEYFGLIPGILNFLTQIFGICFGIFVFHKIRINWFDWVCLLLALFLVGYWVYSKNIIHTVILTVIIDFIAFLPTFKKGWFQPWSETILLYIMAALNQIFTLLTLSGGAALETKLFWGYIIVIDSVFFALIFFRRWYLKGWKSIFE